MRGQWGSGRRRCSRGARGESSEKTNFLPNVRPSSGEASSIPRVPKGSAQVVQYVSEGLDDD
eukprot:393866-Heterocapsa_arctica.AAC.1